MIPLAVIRPEPGWQRTAHAARARGLGVIGHPLFAAGPVDWEPPARGEIDALLIASANAARLAGPGLAGLRDVPAYAVGEQTARAAKDAGLNVIHTGSRDLQSLAIEIAPAHRRLLRLVGRRHGPFEPPGGATVLVRVAYTVHPQPIGPHFAALLRRPAVVALHSAAAASHFAAECERLGIGRAHLAVCAYSDAVGLAAGTGWSAVCTAGAPSDPALLALAVQLCQ